MLVKLVFNDIHFLHITRILQYCTNIVRKIYMLANIFKYFNNYSIEENGSGDLVRLRDIYKKKKHGHHNFNIFTLLTIFSKALILDFF